MTHDDARLQNAWICLFPFSGFVQAEAAKKRRLPSRICTLIGFVQPSGKHNANPVPV
jgi:hypothetical protein